MSLSFSQTNIQVLDRETLKMISNISVFVDGNEIDQSKIGRAYFKNNPSVEEVTFVAEGYESVSLSIDSILRNPIIYLDFIYTPLEGVEVNAKKMELWDIFELVKQNVKNNYIPNNTPLHYQHTAMLYNRMDTASLISYPEIFCGKSDDKFISGNIYKKKGLIVDISSVDTALMNAYHLDFLDVPMFSRSLDREITKSKIKDLSDNYNIFYSGFKRGDHDILDIVLIGKYEQKVDFSWYYPFRKKIPNYERLESLRYVNVQNYHINLTNYAIESYRAFNLTSTSAQLEEIRKIKSREQLTRLITNVLNNRDPMVLIIKDYRSVKEYNNRYVLDHVSVENSLFLPEYRSETPPEYTSHKSWYYLSPVEDPNWEVDYIRAYHGAAFDYPIYRDNLERQLQNSEN